MRAPTHQLRGRRDGFAWRNPICFSGEGVGKKIHPRMDNNGPKNRGWREVGAGSGASAFHWACLHPAALPLPPVGSPRVWLPLSLGERHGNGERKESKAASQVPPQDGELSHRRVLRAVALTLAAGQSLLGSCNQPMAGKGPTSEGLMWLVRGSPR